MKKTIKVIVPVFVVVMAVFLSACNLFTYTVTFVDYKGQFVQERTYSKSETVSNSNSPYAPIREGFNFSKWQDVEDETIKKNYTTDRVMEATYTIDVYASCFSAHGHTLEWYGTRTSSTLNFLDGQTILILIRDKMSTSNFSKFSIQNAIGSAFSPLNITVYDSNAKVCENNAIMWGDWSPGPLESMGEHDFVVEVTAAAGGEAEISLE